jgi:hypothetical protein
MNINRSLASVLAASALAVTMLAPVASAQTVYHVGGKNATLPSSVVAHVETGSALRANDAGTSGTASDGSVGTDGSSDVPTIDYSGIVSEVRANSVAILLVVAAFGIGIAAMMGGFRWVSGYIGRVSKGRS